MYVLRFFNEVFKLINLLFGNFYHLFFLKFHIEVWFMGIFERLFYYKTYTSKYSLTARKLSQTIRF